MYCVILPTTKVFFIFVSIRKPTNTLNHLTNSIYEIYIFCFSYIFYFIVNLFFIGKQILTYLLTYRLHQQRCQVNFLSYLFVTSRNLLFGVFLPKKNYYNITKNSRKCQASVSERCTSLCKHSGMFRQNLSKVPVNKLNL